MLNYIQPIVAKRGEALLRHLIDMASSMQKLKLVEQLIKQLW